VWIYLELLLLSLVGTQDSLHTIGRHGRLHGWTHHVSLACFAIIVLASVAFLLGAEGVGVYCVGPVIGMLIIAGTRNTWELLVRAPCSLIVEPTFGERSSTQLSESGKGEGRGVEAPVRQVIILG
jgi:hypothetical protein